MACRLELLKDLERSLDVHESMVKLPSAIAVLVLAFLGEEQSLSLCLNELVL
jgi:hypothetical protein